MRKKLTCILLVDDDQPTIFINKKIIESAQCTEHIRTAYNGFEAIKYLNGAHENDPQNPLPDIIFLDINMPGMNGWEFLEKYKNLSAVHKSKVIVMLTTSPNPDDLEKAMSNSFVAGYENKPLSKAKIYDILNKYFGPEYIEGRAA